MAWIKKKKTGIITECVNEDVIKICKKDHEAYDVANSIEELQAFVIGEDTGKEDKKDLEQMNVPELKELAKDMGIEGYSNLTKPELLKVLGA